MRFLKSWQFVCAAAVIAAMGVFANTVSKPRAANLPLLTGPLEPSQTLGTLNQLIQSINTGVGGLLNAQTGVVATGAGTAEQVLQTYTMPANTLSVAGQGVIVMCPWTTAATANNKTVKLYFGASVATTPTQAANAQAGFLKLTVFRTAAAAQIVVGEGVAGTGSLTPVAVTVTSGTDDLTAGVVIKCTGTDGTDAAGDISTKGMITRLVK